MGWKKLNARDIQQMVGRAGRAGLDTTGSAIIFCRSPAEFDNVCSLINGPCEELERRRGSWYEENHVRGGRGWTGQDTD